MEYFPICKLNWTENATSVLKMPLFSLYGYFFFHFLCMKYKNHNIVWYFGVGDEVRWRIVLRATVSHLSFDINGNFPLHLPCGIWRVTGMATLLSKPQSCLIGDRVPLRERFVGDDLCVHSPAAVRCFVVCNYRSRALHLLHCKHPRELFFISARLHIYKCTVEIKYKNSNYSPSTKLRAV